MEIDIFDRESGIPVYRQLAEYLKTQISTGVYKPGDVLPSEADLIRDLNISRTTVRLAFGLVANAGLIRREQGKGTIVVSQFKSKLPALSSFTEEVIRTGRKPNVELVERVEEEPPVQAANSLSLTTEDKVLKTIRLRKADEEPIGLAHTWMNTIKFPELYNIDCSALSMYETFEVKLGLKIVNAVENIRADMANDYEARKLKIKPGAAVLRMARTTYVLGEQDKSVPIEYVEAVFNGAVYSVDVELYRYMNK